MTSNRLLSIVRKELQRIAVPEKAPVMQQYMKSKMPYHGVQAPFLKAACKEIFANLKLETQREWREHVWHLWKHAEFREERYAALQLASHKKAKAYQNFKSLPLYKNMVVGGAWWDFVDDIAHRVGEILRNEPVPMSEKMLEWSEAPNLWMRRVSIICQLDFKGDTDLMLLYRCIEPSINSKEFFLQKAIGWALRQYAWTNPREIARYVKQNEKRLSPLSRREALKNISMPTKKKKAGRTNATDSA